MLFNSFKPARDFLREKWDDCRRLRNYSVNGIALTLLGLGMLYIVVSHLGINRFIAQMLLVPLVMAGVSYIVHRRKSFEDRQVCEHTCQRRYAIVRLTGMGVSKVSFLVLVAVVGMPYLFASVLITASLAGPTYKANRDWAFAEDARKRIEKA
ncbi:GtrA family protein [Candidatus Saccharibacteria bacterium]|nr:GtrA family protein [Candidatus Saccharibacteria bacterium]